MLTDPKLYLSSWQCAATFLTSDHINSTQPTSTSYSLPSYLSQGPFRSNQPDPASSHTAAIHEALIPNWTSEGFAQFVKACEAIVDELANAQTTGNGHIELVQCQSNFRQTTWLWKQMWPEVTGMGEETDPTAGGGQCESSQANGNGENSESAIEIQDEQDQTRNEDAPADSPYGGTGLAAIEAHNRAV